MLSSVKIHFTRNGDKYMPIYVYSVMPMCIPSNVYK